MAKWIAGEKPKAGLRYAVVCLNVTGRTQDRIVQNRPVCRGSLAKVDKRQVPRTCILRVVRKCHACSLFLALLFFVLFVFVFLISFKPRPFVQSFFGIHAPRQPHIVTKQLSRILFVLCLIFCSFGTAAFSEYFCTGSSRFVCKVRCTLFPPGWCFFEVTTTDYFLHQ